MLELFIYHLTLKVLDEFETGDLDLPGQICYESSDVCVIPCKCEGWKPLFICKFKKITSLVVFDLLRPRSADICEH